MKKRILSLLLVLVLTIGTISGCSKNASAPADNADGSAKANTPASGAQANELAAKYAYQPTYLELPQGIVSISAFCVSGNTVFVAAMAQTSDSATADSTYTTTLYKIPLDGSAYTALTSYVPSDSAAGSETASVSTSVPAMAAAPDGTFWMLEQNDVFDTASDTADSLSADSTQTFRLLHFDADGALLKELPLEGGFMDSADGSLYISTLLCDSHGYLYLSDWNNAAVLDEDGNVRGTVDISSYGELYAYSADKVGVIDYGANGKGFRALNPETLSLDSATSSIPADAWSLFAGDALYDLYYAKDGNLYGWHADTDTSEKVVDWLACDIDSTTLDKYCVLPDGRIFAISNSYDGETSTTELIVLNRVDASTVTEKTEITLACMNLDWNLRSQIVKFNKENEKYRIVVKDYADYSSSEVISSGAGSVTAMQNDDGLTKLNTEILAGNVPDILITDSLPVRQYAAKGLLDDLWTYIDNDPDFTRDSFISEVLSANETDGKLYELPAGFSVVSAAGLGKIVGSYDSWTLDDLKDAMTKLASDATVFNVDVSKNIIMTYSLYMNADSFVDWENKTANFNSQEFIDLLNFTNSFPEDLDYTTFDFSDYQSDASRMRAGKQLLTLDSSLYGFDSVYQQFARLDNDLCFVGFPSASGHDGNAFMMTTGLAISATSQNKDGAWAFIRSLLSDSYQKSIWYFPIVKSTFEAKAADAMVQEYETDENGNQVLDENGEPIKISKGGFSDGNDPMIELYAMTQEQYDVVLELIHSTHKIMRYDNSLMDIINAETSSFFAGETTAEETAGRIQNRVQLYLAEQAG